MKKNIITNISGHKKEFKTPKMKVPAILHVSDDLMPDDNTLAQIENTASEEAAFHHIAVMSDVHSKKGRKNPTGTAVASEHFLLPQINDTAPNCGKRFLKTNLTDEDLTPENIDKLFRALIRPIPTKAYVGTHVPFRVVMDICKNGVSATKNYFQTRVKNEIENSYKNGNMFPSSPTNQDIFDAIPKLFLHIGKYRLGILGAAGNHYLDLMKVIEIKNPEIAEKFGVHQGQYIFLMHTGSGLLGQYASYMYTPKKKEHLSQKIILELGKLTFRSKYKAAYKKLAKRIESYRDKEKYFTYKDHTPEGHMFLTAHRAAGNHGFANRSILTHNLDQTIQKVLGKDPELDMLYDMPHVFVDRENHYQKDVWVHRNGTTRAYGPARMKDHPLFSKTGEPIFMPSSMSTPAYLGVGTDENESTFFSASHGTGLRKDPESDAAKTKEELMKKMEAKHVRLYNAASKGVVHQDSSYYKDIDEVVAGMVDNKIVNVVAKMEPIAVLMY